MFGLDPAFPSWQPHAEVWVLILAIVGLGFYVTRVIQPKVVAAGGEPITSRQKAYFGAAMVVFWIAADWPIHDIAEERLYWMHMVQHALMTLVVPPLLLLAVPTWLARLVIGDGTFKRILYFWGRPIPAVIVYNFLVAGSHAAWVVNNSVEIGPLHYGVHVVLFFGAMLVWVPVCGPVPELQASPPMKIVTVFLMSLIPTIPAAFLTTAEGVIYQAYNHGPRLWGYSVVSDQQTAGVIMKVITGFYLWGIMAVLFVKWVGKEKTHSRKFRGKLVVSQRDLDDPDHVIDADPADVLTYEQIHRAVGASSPRA